MSKTKDWSNSAGFLMYRDDETIFKMLSPEDCKAVILAVFDYADGNSPEIENEMQKIGFEHIKKHMDANRDSYNAMVEKRKEAARARWQNAQDVKSDANDMQTDAHGMQMDASALQNDAQAMQSDANEGKDESESESDSEYEYDSDNNKDILSSKLDRASITKDIINYLNQKTGKSFRSGSEKTKRIIHARFNEGFTLSDFYTVIDKKVAEWGNDSQMEKFLRPETLFGTKFEGYLNQQFSGKKLSKNDEQLLKIQNGYYEGDDYDETGNGEDPGLFEWGIFEDPSG